MVNYTQKVRNFMKNKIGIEKAVTKKQLFKAVYNRKFNDDSISDYKKWNRLRASIHNMRNREDDFFIQSTPHNKRNGESAKYFIPKTFKECSEYADRMSSHSSGYSNTVVNAQRFVENKNWKRI